LGALSLRPLFPKYFRLSPASLNAYKKRANASSKSQGSPMDMRRKNRVNENWKWFDWLMLRYSKRPRGKQPPQGESPLFTSKIYLP
jgi:hypothetical protein